MSVATTISNEQVDALLRELNPQEPERERVEGARTPVHVVYGGAHLYKADLPTKLGRIALNAMRTWGADPKRFAEVVGAPASVAEAVHARVVAKLERGGVEAACIDFEDGYGPRPDEEEDTDAVRAATELATTITIVAKSAIDETAIDDKTVEGATTAPALEGTTAEPALERPASLIGIRIKSLSAATARRAVRTLDLFVTTLARATQGRVPVGFTVTLPKVTRTEEVSTLAALLKKLETSNGIASGSIGIELMVEAPSALVERTGRVALPALVTAAEGRAVAAHLGAYDLTASLGVTASEQRLDHPACDAARTIMQLALADTDVAVVDGATTILPIARHKATADHALSAVETEENTSSVHEAWALHARNVRRALASGIYQGWDLHPAQLPARYGALYGFFLAERSAMSARLRAFVDRATKATRSGQIFDDAATGQGLLNFFLRGIACGALDATDLTATGLGEHELAERSFAKIVAARSTHTEVQA